MTTAGSPALNRRLRTLAEVMAERRDPREPDHSRPGIFAYHNCWKCSDGQKPCVNENPGACEYPRARND